MKISTHSYTLYPLKELNAAASTSPRKGALLRVEWSLGQTGFSDLFPWPEFGDPTLKDLLEDLECGDFSHLLIKKSLWRNSVDAWARSRRRSLFQSLVMPESHGLLTASDDSTRLALLREMGFHVFKLKMTGQVKKDFALLNSLCHALAPSEKIRLDFNGALSFGEFLEFCDLSKHLMKFVDLIEDPWKADLKDNGLRAKNFPSEMEFISEDIRSKLASDFESHKLWPHKVIKTARAFLPEQRPLHSRVISTHSMDHPLGQAFSLWEAARYQKLFPHRKDVHGLSRSKVYQSTDFDWAWSGEGAKPSPPQGLGIGFDEILYSLKWNSLV